MDTEQRVALEEEARAKYEAYQAKLEEFKKSTEYAKFTKAKLSSAPPTKPTGAPTKPLNAFQAYCKDGLGSSQIYRPRRFRLPD